MARAKRTDRAEARRKYRAYRIAQAEGEGAPEQEPAGDTQQRPGFGRFARPSQQPEEPRPGVRLGVFGAARAAYRTPHYLDDLRSIPYLVLRTKAIWPVALMCGLAAVVAFPRINPTTDLSTDPILSIVLQFILYPMPLLPPMIAGFLAPRGTWLVGIMAALISNLALLLLLATAPINTAGSALASPSPSTVAAASATPSAIPTATVAPSAGSASPAPTQSPSTTASNLQNLDLGQAALTWLPGSIAFGALIGAAAGWYRRFLDLMGPRGQSQRAGQKRPVRKGR